MTTATVRIAIVDDHSIVRQGLRTLLSDVGMQVVGEATSGPEAVTLAETQQPDVMLLDIRMKNGDGLTALPRIKAVSPGTAVIILTTYPNPAYLTQALRDGAAGYLLKESEQDDIIAAIEAAAAHNHLIDPTVLSQALGSSGDAASEPLASPSEVEKPCPPTESISDREHEVLQLIARGLSNAEIATELSVSITTVKTHVKHLLRKLDVHDRTQALVVALRHGLLD